MTLTTTANRKEHVGNGSTTVFAYNFRVDLAGDMKVYLGGSSVAEISGYTVTGLGVDTGGTVVFDVAPANGVSVVLVRDVPYTQDTDYGIYTKFPASVHEYSLDRLEMQIQQLKGLSDRSIRIPEGETNESTTPAESARADRVLGFDTDGDVAVSSVLLSEIEAAVAADRGTGVLMVANYFTGDGSTDTFALNFTPSTKIALVVTVGSVIQSPQAYDLSGSSIVFDEAPDNGEAIVVRNIGYQSSVLPTFGNIVFLSQTDGWASALTAVGSAGTVWVDTPSVNNDALSVSDNVLIQWGAGAIMTGTGSLTGGSLRAGTYQLFGSSVSITGLTYARPEWWGVTGAADHTAINKAITALTRGHVDMTGRYLWSIGGPIITKSYVTLRGTGAMQTEIVLASGSDCNMIETENFANFDADVDYGDLPIFFELRGITLFGNATNQASGMGIALCGASYTIVDVIVKGTKGIGFYSNGHRIPGTNYPIYGDEDNEYAPNCFIDRLKVYRANGDGVYYSGPADSIFGDVVVANGLARGFVVEPSALPDAGTAVFDMNYIHAFANVDCNIEISEGFSCQMLESRDGQAEALIVDTTRNFAVHGAYINNCDRNLTGVNCVTIKDGNAMISNAYIAGQAGGAQDVLVVEDGTPQLENLRIYSDAGTGKALDIQSPTFYAQVSNVSVNGFDPTTPNVTIAGNGHSIKQVNMNAAGCLQCTGTTCILDDIRVISPNDITTAQCIEMGGSLNQLSHAVVRSASNTYGILVSGNKTIINPATFYLFTGSQPIHVTGTNNKVHPGYDDFELITANGALNVTGDTHIDADAGALAVTLAAGGGLLYPHTKRIYMDPSSGNNAVLTFPATTLKDLTGTTKTSITFTAADQFVELEWTRTAWIIKTNYGTTVA